MGIFDTLRHSWDVFRNREPTYLNIGTSASYRPDRVQLSRGNERSIITSIFNRIAVDVSSVNIKHCKVDVNGRFIKDITASILKQILIRLDDRLCRIQL